MKVLGLDIGGTGIKAAIVDTKKGKLLTERKRFETPQPATPQAVMETVKKLVKHFKWKGPIGCGFPAAIKNETVMTASNIDKSWIGLNAGQEIETLTGCPVHLVNDVDAAGYGEAHFGAGKGKKGTVVVVAAGTGIGTAVFHDGHLLPNTELGHLTLHGDIAERYASNAVRKNEDLDWEAWAGRLSEYLNLLELYLWPDLFILGGGVSKHHKEFFPKLTIKTPILAAEHRNNAGIVGAALAARDHFKKK